MPIKLTPVLVFWGLISSSFADAAPAESASTLHVVVAQDGSGDFKTVQQAVDHAPPYGNKRLVIEVRPGTYKERVTVPQDRRRVSFLGSDAFTTVITFSAGASQVGGTFFSSTVDIEGAQFEAANITFENSYGVGTQAVAISVHSDEAVFKKCRFIGWQDTLYAASGRQFYKDCFIEGHVDFIFGNAAAVFEDCEIHSRGKGYVTAQSRTTPDGSTGYVFYHCRLTDEHEKDTVFLGRPWRPYARVVYLNCWLGEQIRPEGWNNWQKSVDEKTAYFGEYESTGPGANQNQRVPWAHILSASEAAVFLPDAFLRGSDHWRPEQVEIK